MMELTAEIRQACDRIEALALDATHFVAADRGEALVRRWLSRSSADESSEAEIDRMMIDASMLSIDLLLSQPSATGSTAFDRLARSRRDASAEDTAALKALVDSRYRLLRLEEDSHAGAIAARDVLSGAELHVIACDLPALPAGLHLFARAVPLAGGLFYLSGATTPLSEAALAVATQTAKAPVMNQAASARWAEAVYSHVTRQGTLTIPGLNRPTVDSDGFEDLDDADLANDPLIALVLDWTNAAGETPDPDLVTRTRQMATQQVITHILIAAGLAYEAGVPEKAEPMEQILMVQLETVLRREASGSGTFTFNAIETEITLGIEDGKTPEASRTVLENLRRRLASVGARPGDQALERLVQRIQGLRAKTVEHGCTEAEALAAAEKVAELLDRHGLSLSELEFRAQPCDGVGVQTDRRRPAPIDDCVPAVAAFFDCRVWTEHGKGEAIRYVFFGLRGDVLAAQYLYELVGRTFETETSAFRQTETYNGNAGDRRKAANSFQIGLARGIAGKLRALRDTRAAGLRSQSGRDLAPIKEAIVEEELGKLGLSFASQAEVKRRRVLLEAYTAGQAAGQRFEITVGITRAA